METDRSFRYSAVVTLANNTTFTLTEDDLVSGGCGLTCSPGSSSFPVGNAICQKLDLSFYNADDQYANTDFFGAVIHPKLEFDLEESGTTETIWFEYYTVTEPETYGSTIEVSAYDAFYKADKPFNQATTFPLTAGTLLQDCCTACGLSCQSARFPNDDFVINTAPEEGTTYRQVIGLIAMLAGGNAVIKNGAVTIVPYNMSWFDDHAGYDGGVFDSASPYRSGDSVSGGSFNPWVVGDENGDTFSDWNSVHYFFETASPTLATDDVVITGVEVRGSEDESYLSGTEGYVLTMENALCTGSEQDAATRIGNLLIGMRFRPFNVDLYSYPLAEIGDNCMICDIRGRYYQSVVTDVTFAFGGYTKVACSADSPVRNSSSYFASTADVKARQIARKISETTVSAYDREVQRMVSLMANSMGMFETVQEQQDGSRITIMHDKPTIGASTKLWKHTADAFMVSNDGGQTWVSGFDVSGNAVLNVLSAIGINFDWAHGGTLTLGGNNNANGSLRVLNSSGTQIGRWNSSGFQSTGGFEVTNTFYHSEDLVSATLKMAFGAFTITPPKIYGNVTPTPIKVAGLAVTRNSATYSALYFMNYDYSDLGTNYIISKNKLVIKADAYSPTSARTSSYYIYLGGNEIKLGGNSGGSTIDIVDSGIEIGSGYKVVMRQAVYVGQASDELSCSFKVYGSKSRVVVTDEYSERLLYCYETPSPMFGDVGEGVIADDGKCYIYLDAIFASTINTSQYQVFLQKYGSGDCWVSERHPGYFVVEGTPDLSFGWELKAKQSDFDQKRLDKNEDSVQINNEIDYGTEAIEHIEELRKEREAA